ncbi:phage tail assembly protein [Roseomonas terrae]|uniref:Phage tail assembly protein n=1 Tax=Neoroseomonas terrae TaxID=424799 RepID=A0ABS5EH94_9PROT|nr:hypothetical protein [Neoroseomonas terrae]MBR0650378.1 phage tail assembly protein [Neoroseomonas terrae]
MSDDTPRTDEQRRIVEMWGEGFARLAGHARIEFGDGDIRVALWRPIKVGGESTEELRIVEPTIDQLQQLDRVQGEMGKVRRLLMQAAGLTEKEAGTIGLRDMGLFGMIMEAFSETARATGA